MEPPFDKLVDLLEHLEQDSDNDSQTTSVNSLSTSGLQDVMIATISGVAGHLVTASLQITRSI